MPYDLSKLLVIAISSSALFDSREEHSIFLSKGVEEYVAHQLANEGRPLAQGTAFPLIAALLRLNQLSPDSRLVEVVILSHMQPEPGLRVMNSVEHHGLDITRAAFTGGEPVARYLKAYNVTLFLSRNEADVREALESGIAAGLLYDPPEAATGSLEQLRIAFDGDAVIFSDESERIYQSKGLEAFVAHEIANTGKPLLAGPFAPFLRAIAKIQSEYHTAKLFGVPPIETALVTARNSPMHKRVILTLRAWGVKIDKMFFLGGVSKDQVLAQFHPHIFFDDQDAHAKPASLLVPSARVPGNARATPEIDRDQGVLPFSQGLQETPPESPQSAAETAPHAATSKPKSKPGRKKVEKVVAVSTKAKSKGPRVAENGRKATKGAEHRRGRKQATGNRLTGKSAGRIAG